VADLPLEAHGDTFCLHSELVCTRECYFDVILSIDYINSNWLFI